MTDEEHHTWTPVWAMPNVMSSEPIASTFVAMVGCRDPRLRAVGKRHPILTKFLNRFRDEFGGRIWPTVLMFRDDAPPSIRTKEALCAFRDAVSISAITSSHSRVLKWGRPAGIHFSDAFDFYPWHLGSDWSEHVYAFTPAITGIHEVVQLRGQSAPALGERMLGQHDLDGPLLAALLERWHDCYGAGNDTAEHRRLFRAVEMARAASKSPGGADSTFYDGGRAVALWVSAFEILAHDGKADLRKVLELLGRAPWERRCLQAQNRPVIYRGAAILTNTAGIVYNALYQVRNAFLHGNPVTHDDLKLQPSGKHILQFAAPIFRAALAASLDLQFPDELPDLHTDPEGATRFSSHRMDFLAPQRQAEDAILVADADPVPADR